MTTETMSFQTTATLVALAEIAEAINKDLPLDMILSHIVNTLGQLIPSDAMTIALADENPHVLNVRAAINRAQETILSRVGKLLPISDFPTAQLLIETKTMLYLPDVTHSDLWRVTSEESSKTKAFFGVPLLAETQVVGLLFIDFYEASPLSEEARYAILAFARYAASAIHSAQRRERLLRSEDRYRSIASLTSNALYEWELQTDHVQWSDGIDTLLDYDPQAFSRSYAAWNEAIHPNDLSRILAARETTLQDGLPFEHEYRLKRQSNTYCHVLDRAVRLQVGEKTLLVGAISDLTGTYDLTDALVESEERYRTLFTRAIDAIFVTDKDAKLLDFNPAAEQLTGHDYAQLIASPLTDLITLQHQELFIISFAQLKLKGDLGAFELRFTHAEGIAVDVEMWGAALGNDTYQLAARDISARKQSQILAAQRVADLTALSNLTRATYGGGEINETLQRVLPVAMEILTMPLGCLYLLDKTVGMLRLVAHEGYLPHYLPDALLPAAAAEAGRLTPYSPLVRIIEASPGTSDQWRRKMTLQVPLVANEHMIGLVMFSDIQARITPSTDIYMMDIIGRQVGVGIENVRLLDNLEQLVQERTVALFSTETRYQSLIEQVPGVVYTSDKIHGSMSFISSGTELLFGLAPPQFIHVDDILMECIKTEDKGWVYEHANRSHLTGEDFDTQYRIINAQNGLERWVHHRARLVMGGTGESFWLGLITDVTNLKELDEMKNRFVATVSHELRTPISAIKLRAATLQNYYHRLSEPQRLEMLERISYQADILGELVDDILRLAKLDGSNVDRQIEIVDMNEIAETVFEELYPAAENAGLSLEVILAEHPCMIKAEVTDISRIWRNLIGNAIKYTPMPGRVRAYTGIVQLETNHKVLASTLPDALVIAPDMIPTGSWVLGVVEDTGKGISESDQEHIFTRFYRGEAAHTNVPGTGLGLSLVKELLNDYEGFITYRSLLGKGSTFCFWIRAYEEPLAAS